MGSQENFLICSFCKRQKWQARKLIAARSNDGQTTIICDSCIDICYGALKKSNNTSVFDLQDLPKPEEMFNYLNTYVAGQTQAKKNICTAVYYHYKRIEMAKMGIEDQYKTNLLMIGPTGSGKTYLIETLAKLLKVPFVSRDSTTLTEVGYVGGDVQDVLAGLYYAANGNLEAAQHGIVFFDEFDKTAQASNNTNHFVKGTSVQREMLKMFEGDKVTVSLGNKKNPNTESIVMDTKNILFICAGAFTDLSKIVERDIRIQNIAIPHSNKTIEHSKYDDIMQNLTSDHLIKFGILSELLGRLPKWIVLKELTTNDLLDILLHKKNSIFKHYQKLLEIKDNCKLEIEAEAALSLARRAIPLGARSLVAMMEQILSSAMYKMPSMAGKVKIIIDKVTVDKILGKEPKINEYTSVVHEEIMPQIILMES